MKRARTNATIQGARVAIALHKMATGEARSKREASEMTGMHPGQLNRGNLEPVIRNNPEIRRLIAASPFDVTCEHNGSRISLREACARMIERAVWVIAEHGPKLGDLDRAQRTALNDARQVLTWARELGLWKDDAPIDAPSELRHGPEEGSLEWYLRDGNRHDQRKRKGVIVVETEPAIPP